MPSLTFPYLHVIFFASLIIVVKFEQMEKCVMQRIQTLETRNLCESAKNGGCGECQTSCQSACKTSCGIANQQCENKEEK